jgi:transposase
MKYSIGFRNSVLRKVLPPESRSPVEVSKEVGINVNSIYNWMNQLKSGKMELLEGLEQSVDSRSPQEKLNLLLEAKTISTEKKGEWLRQSGLHEEHLVLWEQELKDIMADKSEKLKKEYQELKKRNKELEKELLRKDKALAEMAVIIALKKKASEYFAAKEDE